MFKRHRAYSNSDLIKRTLKMKLGQLSSSGALVVETGTNTGRSTSERFIVRDASTEKLIHWGNVNQPIDRDQIDLLFQRAIRKILDSEQYEAQGYISYLPIEAHCKQPWHALFARTMFRKHPIGLASPSGLAPTLRIYHDPHGKVSDYNINLPTEKIILIDFRELRVLIIGTAYAGEIKKSAFALANFLLPQEGLLTMHASANCLSDGSNASILFGLSGTGKTTLSADPSRPLIGDDEILWSASGLSNIEGGCYAKLVHLEKEKEPLIFQAVNRKEAIQENVILDADGSSDFANTSLTENTRGSYPIEALGNVFSQRKEAKHPSTIVFLTADAFGALPALSRLTAEQARYHFLSGYTAKLAGTELGVKEPIATFSTCFGAPFMPLHPTVYADLLSQRIQSHGCSVWLLNTGWQNGGYASGGVRFPISVSRALLKAVQGGQMENEEFETHPIFGFSVAKSCPGVDQKFLTIPPLEASRALAKKFVANFSAAFPHLPPLGGPKI